MNNLNPKDFIPEWDDEERISFLYSAFPSDKSVNPHHWESKLLHWKTTITLLASSDEFKHCHLKWTELCKFLSKNNKQPLGLSTVLDDMLSKGEIYPLNTYLQDIQANETWIGWGINCVRKPGKWVLGKVLSPIKKQNLEQSYVIPQAVDTKCSKLLSVVQNCQSNDISPFEMEHCYLSMGIFSFNDLFNLSKDIVSDVQSLDILIAKLKQSGKAAIYIKEDTQDVDLNDRKYIKFLRKTESKVFPINEANIGCIELHKTRIALERSIHDIYDKVDVLNEKIKTLLRQKKKSLALNTLRKKRILLDGIKKKESALHNIETLLQSIAQCKSDKLILDAYTIGIKTYKDTLKNERMTVESVEETKSELENVLNMQQEIGDILSSPVELNGEDISEKNLEEELNSILEKDLESAFKNLNIGNKSDATNDIKVTDDETVMPVLPDVPENDIIISSKPLDETVSKTLLLS